MRTFGLGGGEAGSGLEEFVKYITCVYVTIRPDPDLEALSRMLMSHMLFLLFTVIY